MLKNAEKVVIERLNQLIESNFDNPSFSPDHICRELGVSRSQLYRLVKEYSQLSISLYVRQRKLLRAREMLTSSDLKISEIAYKLGIDSPQNFSKYFVQEFGISPTEFRKQQNNLPVPPPAPQVTIPEKPDISDVPVVAKTMQRPKYFLWGIATLLILSIIASLYFYVRAEEGISEAGFSGNSIAILPFESTGPPENDFFARGIMHQIHGSLGIISKLKVISTTSSDKYRDTQKLIPQIARELNVNYVMEGSVMQSGDRIRIVINLINAEKDASVWTKKYEGGHKEMFSFMNEVAAEVTKELDQKLTDLTSEQLGRGQVTNPEAYRAYVQGRELIGSRTKEKLEAGLAKLSEAVESDPGFAPAYASRSLAYYLLGEGGFMESAASHRLSEQNALTAIRLDGNSGLSYANLANIYRDQNKWEQARTAYEIALKHSPNDAQINYWFSLLLRTTGNPGEAIRYSTKAAALDPLNHVIHSGHIANCIYNRDFDKAQKIINEGELLFNDSFAFQWTKGVFYITRKDYQNAIGCLKKAGQLNPGLRAANYLTYYSKAKLGQVSEADAFLSRLPPLPEYFVSRAVVYAGLNNKSQCLYYLKKAAENNIIPTDIKVLPYFDIVRDDPGFKDILKKFGL